MWKPDEIVTKMRAERHPQTGLLRFSRRPDNKQGGVLTEDMVKAWITARPEQVIAVVGHGGLWQRILGYHLKNCGFQWMDWGVAASDE